MKQYTNIALILISSCILLGCGVDQSEYDKVKKERDKFELTIKQQDTIIQHLRDTVSMLSYPASQRFIKINGLVSEGKYEEAQNELQQLSALFPESKEAQSIPSISAKIDNLIAKQKAEEERRKALGFKGLKPLLSATIDYNKVSFSNFSISNTLV